LAASCFELIGGLFIYADYCIFAFNIHKVVGWHPTIIKRLAWCFGSKSQQKAGRRCFSFVCNGYLSINVLRFFISQSAYDQRCGQYIAFKVSPFTDSPNAIADRVSNDLVLDRLWPWHSLLETLPFLEPIRIPLQVWIFPLPAVI
jgi:hypothetical protein